MSLWKSEGLVCGFLSNLAFPLLQYRSGSSLYLDINVLEHYNQSFHFPGGHTPTADEITTWYVPLIEKMLMEYPRPVDGSRYFQHFKGGKYRYIRTAFDSETRERMVIYQALYGDKQFWVRPEKMFFENIERDGRAFARFTEIDK